jgi:chromosome segregation ATPase
MASRLKARPAAARLGNPKLDVYRRDMDKAREEIDQAEDIIFRQKREINDIRNMNDSLEQECQRMKKQKLKLQSEVDQLNAIFESERNAIADLQLRLKKQGKIIKEEQQLRNQVDEDNRDLQKTIKQMELKMENLTKQNQVLDKAATELEQVRKTLLGQVETLIESRDAAKELYLEMETEKSIVDAKLRETEALCNDLETQYETAQQNFLNMQGAYHVLKDQHAKDVARADEKLQEEKRKFDQLERSSKLLLDEEKKRREQILAAKKGLESQVENLSIDLDEAKTRVEEQLLVIKKLQVQLEGKRELEEELEIANEMKESLSRQAREAEKKVKAKDLEIESLVSDAQGHERARRQAEEDAQATLEEAEQAKATVMAARAEEKRNLDLRIAETEADLSEESVLREDADIRCERLSTDNKDLAEQLAQETDTRKNLEVVKNRLEKQKMDLENEVSKLDATMKSKIKETTEAFERRVHQMEQTLEEEKKEREKLSKDLKRAEKALDETSVRLDDAEEDNEAHKTQLDKMTKKNDALNRELAVKEDDLLRLQSLRVQLEGELEEKNDATEAAKREITRLRGSQAATRTGTRAQSRMELADMDELDD